MAIDMHNERHVSHYRLQWFWTIMSYHSLIHNEDSKTNTTNNAKTDQRLS